MSVVDFRDLVEAGRLTRLFRGIYLDTQQQHMTEAVVRRGALAYADRNIEPDSQELRAFLCCESAGAEHSLPACRPARVTVSVPRVRSVRPHAGLAIHRHDRADVITAPDGVRASAVAQTVVQSFGRLPTDAAREMVLRTIQSGLACAADIRAHVASNQPRRRELLELLDLAGDGAHSALEIAAVLGIIRRFGLSSLFRQQYAVQTAGGGVVMDFAAPEFKVNLETDGSRFHSSPDARSRDNRRDLELHRDGWHVVRALYEQVIDRPEQVATALMAVLLQRGWKGRPATNEGRLAVAALP